MRSGEGCEYGELVVRVLVAYVLFLAFGYRIPEERLISESMLSHSLIQYLYMPLPVFTFLSSSFIVSVVRSTDYDNYV